MEGTAGGEDSYTPDLPILAACLCRITSVTEIFAKPIPGEGGRGGGGGGAVKGVEVRRGAGKGVHGVAGLHGRGPSAGIKRKSAALCKQEVSIYTLIHLSKRL